MSFDFLNLLKFRNFLRFNNTILEKCIEFCFSLSLSPSGDTKENVSSEMLRRTQ